MDDIISDAENMAEGRPDRPGAVLRSAREEKGMSIGDVADVTRVGTRQLEAIERSDFRSLPGTPYAVGFARAYARAVGVDEAKIAHDVREELGALDAVQHYEAFEPLDPARIPPRSLAWIAAAIALVLAVGYGVWRTQFFAASTDQEISELSNRAGGQSGAPAVQPTVSPAPVTGPVVLTATDTVWLKIYDQAGERLFEREMQKGESFTVPADADNPMILTGRPDALSVTVGGRPVAPLGPPQRTVADLPISAAALLARPTPGEQAQAPATQSAAPPASSVPASATAPARVSSSPQTEAAPRLPASTAAAAFQATAGGTQPRNAAPPAHNAVVPAAENPTTAKPSEGNDAAGEGPA
ncbi:MAG: RodZ domain-containing protein [Sphingobium sp.]